MRASAATKSPADLLDAAAVDGGGPRGSARSRRPSGGDRLSRPRATRTRSIASTSTARSRCSTALARAGCGRRRRPAAEHGHRVRQRGRRRCSRRRRPSRPPRITPSASSRWSTWRGIFGRDAADRDRAPVQLHRPRPARAVPRPEDRPPLRRARGRHRARQRRRGARLPRRAGRRRRVSAAAGRAGAAGRHLQLCSGAGTAIRAVVAMLEAITGHRMAIRVNPQFVRADEPQRIVGSPRALRASSASCARSRWPRHWRTCCASARPALSRNGRPDRAGLARFGPTRVVRDAIAARGLRLVQRLVGGRDRRRDRARRARARRCRSTASP